jgi:hypothetical protein
MTCTHATRLIHLAIDSEIDRDELVLLANHIQGCGLCREEAETQFLVRRVLAARPPDSLPDGLATRLSARLDSQKSGWLDLVTWWGRMLRRTPSCR